jgi:4-amino-4-deoxy-L-arabinose transferase-like glycosyltransferase
LCLTVVLAAQVALFTRLLSTALDFDEGVYLLAVATLRSGQRLGTDVFAAQPPAFYWILRSIAATLGEQSERIRLGIALLAACGTAAVWVVVRTIAGPVAGVLAAALVTISPPIPLFAPRILADLPSLWLGVGALALGAVATRRQFRYALIAAAAGGLAVLAVATKVSAAITVPVLVVILVSGGGPVARRLGSAVAGAAAVGLATLVANAAALGDLWNSVVTYHRQASSTPTVIDRWASIADLFNPRTPAFWLVVAGVLVFALRVGLRRALLAEYAFWGWAIVAFVFLATYSPIHYNHLVALPVPLALAAAASLGAQVTLLRGRGRDAAIVVLVFVVVAGFAQQWRRVAIAHESQSAAEKAAAGVLGRVTEPHDLVATDMPVSAVLANRLVPGPLVDTAYLRFQTGSLTPEEVLAEIDRWCVAAVVAGRAFADEPAVMRGLKQRFASSAAASGATVVFDRRQPCRR